MDNNAAATDAQSMYKLLSDVSATQERQGEQLRRIEAQITEIHKHMRIWTDSAGLNPPR